MDGRLCCLLPDEPAGRPAHRRCRRSYGWTAHDFDENCAWHSWSFQRIRMAGAWNLERARVRSRLAATYGSSSGTCKMKFIAMKLKIYLQFVCYLSVAWMLATNVWAAPQTSSFDVVIVNGHIIDGTGSPWYSG